MEEWVSLLRCNSKCQFHNILLNLYKKKKRRRKKIDKDKDVKKHFFLYNKRTNNRNTKVVMFINFAMYRGVYVCVCKNKNIFSQE